MPTLIDINEPIIQEIGKLADEYGFEVYIIGGYVRDYFLQRERYDFDFTVVGNSIEFAKIVAKKYNSKIVTYEAFQTAMVPIGGQKIEFVGTRKEVYKKSSRNPIVEIGSLEDDIKRRDFTVNTLAASINNNRFGEVIDLYNGLQDLQDKILRTPLDPKVTFSDDPLRMLRAARFASQLGFELVSEAKEAISNQANRITIISQERITEEFLKILASPTPSIGLGLLYTLGLMKYIFPEVDRLAGIDIIDNKGHKDVFWHTLKVVDNITYLTENVWLRFSALMHDIAKPATKKFIKGSGWTFHGHEELGARWMSKIFRRMKFPFDELKFVETMVRLHQRPMFLVGDDVTDAAIRRLIVDANGWVEELFTLCRADITTKNPNLSKKYLSNYDKVTAKIIDVQERDKLRNFQSPVRGEEIIEICRIKPSKLVGYIKFNIEEAILDGIIPNEYEEAKVYFLSKKDEWIAEYNSSDRVFIQRRG